ncbi:MAG: hypothetical protein Q7U40_06105, partial [Desulfatirhabdiaceae bacterium]|nr:hypothetical protein [Desulfatirhabdiaceae bacterium]
KSSCNSPGGALMNSSMRLFCRNGVYYVEIGRGKWRSLKTRDEKTANGIFRDMEKEYLRGRLLQWVFRRKPPPDSDPFRHLIPIQVATQFRLIPPWESDSFRHPLERV